VVPTPGPSQHFTERSEVSDNIESGPRDNYTSQVTGVGVVDSDAIEVSLVSD